MDIKDKILLGFVAIATVVFIVVMYRFIYRKDGEDEEDLQSIIDEKDRVIEGQHQLINSQKSMISEMLLELKSKIQ